MSVPPTEQQDLPALCIADGRIVQGLVPAIGGWFAGLQAEELANLIRGDVDVSDVLPKYQDVKGWQRGLVRARLAAAPETHLAEHLLEHVRHALHQNYPVHWALLGEPEGRAWYARNVERMRLAILTDLGG